MRFSIPIASFLTASLANAASISNRNISRRDGGDMANLSNQCGASNAGGDAPNGQKYWLNCGLDGSGWSPAYVQISDLNLISDDQALSSSAFSSCVQYADQFRSASQSTGVPLVVLMSIAMEESSCNAGVTGQRGEVGIMQITNDKCDPNVNCYDPGYNIQTGASYLNDQINAQGGNVLLALGGYNGWYQGMVGSGTCGPDGQNLDYVNGLANSWFQGKDGYGNISGVC